MRYLLPVLLFCTLFPLSGKSDSWQEALKNKEAQLDLYWFTSIPFILDDSHGNLSGIEYEIIEEFREFLQRKYSVELTPRWIESKSFSSILEIVSSSKNPSTLGASAFSITEERKKTLGFSKGYLPDITVLVSSQGTPIVRNFDEIHSMMQGMQAITIKGTIYETLLLKMRDQINVNFEIQYIDSDENVLDHISSTDNMFGFIDLPIYLMWIKNESNLTRQNFFTIKGVGYAYIMPLGSDWNIPFDEFLEDEASKVRIAEIIAKYLGDELYQFIDDSFDREQLGTYILTKEKEIQLALTKNANLKLEKEKTYKKLLLAGVIVSLAFLIVIIYFYRKNQKTTELLVDQKNQIVEHQNDIKQKNEQLMNRNAQLLALNEDKNNLVNILAHDLRSPLSHILGLSGILESNKSGLSDENIGYLEKINESANRMNQMIVKILDVGTLDRNKNTVLKENVNVTQLIHDLTARYQPVATNKNILLTIKLPEKPLNLVTDHMLLFLVLENLLSNAVKFSEFGKKVYLEVEEQNDELLFKVTDQGPGFTEKDKSRVFNRFQKLSAQPTGGETSTGLGLSIVKKYVADLQGKVWLESTPGQGSTFFVSLKSKVLQQLGS